MTINPGSAHFNISDGSALITYSDYKVAGDTVSGLSNNPSVVLS